MAWWLKNNLRMIQNNIRDIDIKTDPKRYVEWLKYFHANTLQIGCGGITANHPSRLPSQMVNPDMSGDFLKEIIEECHGNGIRVIARFDFSKTSSSFLEEHPDWYVRNAAGEPILYHDTAAACVNGGYQQEESLGIIREVLENYQVDGIFFNMFGYITSDYSGNYFGPCQCGECRRKYHEMYGKALPTAQELLSGPDENYEEFKRITVDQLLTRIKGLVTSVRPDVAVSTYAQHGVDIVRSESNSAVDRPLPFWIYNSEDNVGSVRGSYPDKIASNCCINAVDLPYRFMGVSRYLNAIRLYGNMAAGGGLDWCIIGSFDDYTDYENFDMVKDIFAFHEKYEEYYGHFDTRSGILLVKEDTLYEMNSEYRGIFRMLKENHLQFTVVCSGALEGKIEEFDEYDFILLPKVGRLGEPVKKALARTKARIIASGRSLDRDPQALEELFGVRLAGEVTDVRGTYFLPEPREYFPDFPEKKWILLDGAYDRIELFRGSIGMLPKVEKAMFGPPERCYGHVKTDHPMAAVSRKGNIFLPWNIGDLYYRLGYDEFSRTFLDLMNMAVPVERDLVTNAPAMVELFLNACGENTYMLQAINMTGFNGTTFFEPLEVRDIRVECCRLPIALVEELTPAGKRQTEYEDSTISFTFRAGEVYKAYLIHTDKTAASSGKSGKDECA